MRIAARFGRGVRGYAKAHGNSGQRKHELAD
jgi:hypothetical protein